MYGLYGKSGLGIVGYAISQLSTTRHGHGDFQLSSRTWADRHSPWTETHHEHLKPEIQHGESIHMKAKPVESISMILRRLSRPWSWMRSSVSKGLLLSMMFVSKGTTSCSNSRISPNWSGR